MEGQSRMVFTYVIQSHTQIHTRTSSTTSILKGFPMHSQAKNYLRCDYDCLYSITMLWRGWIKIESISVRVLTKKPSSSEKHFRVPLRCLLPAALQNASQPVLSQINHWLHLPHRSLNQNHTKSPTISLAGISSA